MVMTRMERLERENQELMQILLQMQVLLQEQQQRNARLNTPQSNMLQMQQPPVQLGMPMQQQPPFGAALSPMMPLLPGQSPLLPPAAAPQLGFPIGAAQQMPAIAPAFPPSVPQMAGTTPMPAIVAAPPPKSTSAPALPQGTQQSQKRKAPSAPDAARSVGGALTGAPKPAVASNVLQAYEHMFPAKSAADGLAADSAAADGENAPWKSQRKRQRRTPRGGARETGGGAVAVQQAAGLAAYHDALLGV